MTLRETWKMWVWPVLGPLLSGVPTLLAFWAIIALVFFLRTGDLLSALGIFLLVAVFTLVFRLSFLVLFGLIATPFIAIAAMVGPWFARRSAKRDALKATRFPYEQS